MRPVRPPSYNLTLDTNCAIMGQTTIMRLRPHGLPNNLRRSKNAICLKDINRAFLLISNATKLQGTTLIKMPKTRPAKTNGSLAAESIRRPPVEARSGGNSVRRSEAWTMIAPFKQGTLDNLCGVYAIVNSLCVITSSTKRFDIRTVEEIFSDLLVEVDQTIGLLHALQNGIDTAPLALILNRAAETLAADLGMLMHVERPWLHDNKVELAVVLKALRKRFRKGAVALVGLGGALDHWSVAIEVTPRFMRLFDSAGFSRVSLACCRMNHAPPKGGVEHIVEPDAVFIISRLR